MARDNLNWLNVNTETLSRPAKRAQTEYKASAAVTRTKREAFEAAISSALVEGGKVPDGHEVLFSHKFGKLAVAFAPVTTKRAKGGTIDL